MINGVILNKLQSLDGALNELKSLGRVEAADIEGDWRTRRAVERNLQVLVEIVIDVSQCLISLQGQTPVATGVDAIEKCVELGVLSQSQPYGRMVQFRKFIVHRYEQVEVAYLVSMLTEHLDDFEQCRTEIMARVQG